VRCSSVRPRLSAYQDCELGPSETCLIDQHLAGCASCTREYQRLEQVDAPIEVVIPPPMLLRLHRRTQVDRVLRLAQNSEHRSAIDWDLSPPPQPGRPATRTWAWVAAATVLFSLFGWAAHGEWTASQASSSPFPSDYYHRQSRVFDAGGYQPVSWSDDTPVRYR